MPHLPHDSRAYPLLDWMRCVLLFMSLLAGVTKSGCESEVIRRDPDQWSGFQRHNFTFDGVPAMVILPSTASDTASDPGGRWIWRARFFGHEPQLDLALLGRGYHLVYCDVSNLYGSPKAVTRWNDFYAWVRSEYPLREKVVLEGMSRGGLIIYNWAAQNPEKVSAIYADAPVLDIRSWPGGFWAGKKSQSDWDRCLNAYGVTENELPTLKINPIDHLEPLAEAQIPILHVVGLADDVVPVAENSDVLVKKLRALGGTIQVIEKRGVGHHPHSLKNPDLILNFLDRFSL